MHHQFTIEPVSEAVALTKRCARNPATTCAASGCMAWASVAPSEETRRIEIPPQVAAKHNAANADYIAACAAATDTGEPVADELTPDDSALVEWIAGLVSALAPDGWRLEDGASIETWLSEWYDGGWLEGEIEPGALVATFERAVGSDPRGICAYVARRY